MSCTELAGTIDNPFFHQKYNRHALLYSYSNEQLPLIVRTTKSFVLPKEPVTVKANSKLDIKTGIALIRKPPGCQITLSFIYFPLEPITGTYVPQNEYCMTTVI